MFSHSSQPQPGTAGFTQAEAERRELQEEIDKLKHDKVSLLSDIQKHAEKKQFIDLKMQSLEEKLQLLESCQRELIAYLGQIVSKPGFVARFLSGQSSDHVNKRRRHEDVDMVESTVLPLTGLDTEPFDRIESSLHSLETFFRGVSEACGEENMFYDSVVSYVPASVSGVVLTEINGSSEDTTGPNLAESSSRSQSPVVAVLGQDIATALDTRNNKVSEIDMNSEPTVADAEPSHVENHNVENQNRNTGQNDVFWQQFLQEQPGSNEEVQSERRELAVDMRNEKEGFWLSRKKNGESLLTEKMGHLTSLEKT